MGDVVLSLLSCSVCYFNYDDLGFSVAFSLLSLFRGHAYAPAKHVHLCVRMCQ